MHPFIIGISGVTGSGKSTLAKALAVDLNATLIAWDDFDEISSEPNDFIKWYDAGCHYEEFQREALARTLSKLKMGDNAIHPVMKNIIQVTQYIIFDAPLGRLHSQTGQYIDIAVHIEVPLDVSLCRRILRDFKGTEKTKEEVLEELNFYLNYSRPLFFDNDLKKCADL